MGQIELCSLLWSEARSRKSEKHKCPLAASFGGLQHQLSPVADSSFVRRTWSHLFEEIRYLPLPWGRCTSQKCVVVVVVRFISGGHRIQRSMSKRKDIGSDDGKESEGLASTLYMQSLVCRTFQHTVRSTASLHPFSGKNLDKGPIFPHVICDTP